MNVVDYLINITGFPVNRNQAKSILVDRAISESTLAQYLTVKERDLLRADILMLVASFPSSASGSVKKSGDFEIRSSGYSNTRVSDLIKAAMAIYKTYGDAKYDEQKLGMIIWCE